MTFLIVAGLILSLLNFKCSGLLYRCLEDKAISVCNNRSSDTTTVLQCVRHLETSSDNAAVTFLSYNRTCCVTIDNATTYKVTKLEGATICIRADKASMISTTAQPSATPVTTTTTTLMTPVTLDLSLTSIPIAATTLTTATATYSHATGNCSSNWTSVGDHCFQHVHLPLPWADAQNYCISLGGNLAHLYNVSDIMDLPYIITNYAGGIEPWIGLNDLTTEGIIVGVIAQPVTSSVAARVFLNNSGKDCSYLVRDQTSIFVTKCSDTNTFFCESGRL